MTNTTGGLNISGSGTAMVTILDNDDATSPHLRILLTSERTFPEGDFVRNGLPVKLFCSDNCSGEITLSISQANAQRYRLRTTTLATRTFTQSGDRNFRYRLDTSTSTAGRLKNRSGALPVTITATARDTNGNSITKSVRTSIR